MEPQAIEDTEDPQTDHNHPSNLQASDILGVPLIPMKLTSPENYGVWSRQSRIY